MWVIRHWCILFAHFLFRTEPQVIVLALRIFTTCSKLKNSPRKQTLRRLDWGFNLISVIFAKFHQSRTNCSRVIMAKYRQSNRAPNIMRKFPLSVEHFCPIPSKSDQRPTIRDLFPNKEFLKNCSYSFWWTSLFFLMM